MQSEHFEKLKRMYLSAPINKLFKPEIEITETETIIRMEIKRDYFHAAGALHGSIYFKMLDDAAFFAANSILEDSFALTSNFNIHYFKPVTEGVLTAKGKLIFHSRSQFVSEASLYLEDSTKVAFGSGTFVKSHKTLAEEIGYK